MNKANRLEIIQHYGIDGYRKIVEMDYQDNIMKNYKDGQYREIKNYYPQGLSLEDIHKYIKDHGGDTDGINARVFEKFTCDRDTEEYLGLFERIRNRQLFETKLGIRDYLGNPALAEITTKVLNNKTEPLFGKDNKYMTVEEMDRSLVEKTDESRLPKASQVMNGRYEPTGDDIGNYEEVHEHLVAMKMAQDEWFKKIPWETAKKIICVNLPIFACFIASLVGCAFVCGMTPPMCSPYGGAKKRKSKKKKYVKKKKTTRKTKKRKTKYRKTKYRR